MSEKPDSWPTLTVVGGPNGAGKSTLVADLQTAGYPLGVLLNPDEIAKTLSGSGPARDLQAGRATLRQSRALIANRTTFTRESTLSSTEILRTMQAAKAAGFRVVLHFVAVSDVETTMARVRSRVAQGGHDIAGPVQARRFDKTFLAARRAAQIADTAYFIHNGRPGHRIVGMAEQGRVTYRDRQTAPWIKRATQGLALQAGADQAPAGTAMKDP